MFVKIKPGKCEIENNNHYVGYDTVATHEEKRIYAKGAARLYQGNTSQATEADYEK